MCDTLSMYTCVSGVSVIQIVMIRLMKECNEKETLVLYFCQQCSIDKKGKCFCKKSSYTLRAMDSFFVNCKLTLIATFTLIQFINRTCDY